MTERPILFKGRLVREILAGNKTQTRRVVKPQLQINRDTVMYGNKAAMLRRDDGSHWSVKDGLRTICRLCPYGQPGDRLWVRETCKAEELDDGRDGVRYAADDHWEPIANGPKAAGEWCELFHYRGKRGATVPNIHTPRWASRITLEVTGVRVERIQDITEADAIAEGIGSPVLRNCKVPEFARTWDEINGPRGYGWDANPWVWVVSFKKVEA